MDFFYLNEQNGVYKPNFCAKLSENLNFKELFAISERKMLN